MILHEPLTIDAIRAATTDSTFITGQVLIDLDDMLGADLDGLLDLMSKRLTGSPCGMEIDYKPVGVEDGLIVMEITLDASMILDDED